MAGHLLTLLSKMLTLRFRSENRHCLESLALLLLLDCHQRVGPGHLGPLEDPLPLAAWVVCALASFSAASRWSV